jgi:hypothetical protein
MTTHGPSRSLGLMAALVIMGFAQSVAAQECAEGPACLPTEVAEPPPRSTAAPRLASPVRLEVGAPATPPLRINHNVIGGGVLLFLATYAGSLTLAFFGGGIPYLVPLASFYGVVQGPFSGSLGFVFGAGQVIGIILMVAGATFFRHRATDWPLRCTSDGIAVMF